LREMYYIVHVFASFKQVQIPPPRIFMTKNKNKLQVLRENVNFALVQVLQNWTALPDFPNDVQFRACVVVKLDTPL
jgi:hypothetical protein